MFHLNLFTQTCAAAPAETRRLSCRWKGSKRCSGSCIHPVLMCPTSVWAPAVWQLHSHVNTVCEACPGVCVQVCVSSHRLCRGSVSHALISARCAGPRCCSSASWSRSHADTSPAAGPPCHPPQLWRFLSRRLWTTHRRWRLSEPAEPRCSTWSRKPQLFAELRAGFDVHRF